jgi:hypothetical protein
MAGAANCAKIRLTARKQWFGQADAPELQTISFNGRVSEKLVQELSYSMIKRISLSKGVKFTMSYSQTDLNQLSFGISKIS